MNTSYEQKLNESTILSGKIGRRLADFGKLGRFFMKYLYPAPPFTRSQDIDAYIEAQREHLDQLKNIHRGAYGSD
jgi:hypothetical protein